MSESFPASAGGASADADRDARIEQLLLSGLDQYFAGHYQQAINIWTRVVFLERGHSRARAYIERARSASNQVRNLRRRPPQKRPRRAKLRPRRTPFLRLPLLRWKKPQLTSLS